MEYLEDLNPAQRAAILETTGPLLVVAGAGSGKTKTLTYRIAYLLDQGWSPSSILAVTFTNKAAREMRDRIEALLQRSRGWPLEQVRRQVTNHIWMGTFHSLCVRILRQDLPAYTPEDGLVWTPGFSIVDTSTSQGILSRLMRQVLNLDTQQYDPKDFKETISFFKNRGLTVRDVEDMADNRYSQLVANAYRCYQQELSRQNSLDFDDLILIPVQLFEQRPDILAKWHERFQHILVDEYQDTNQIQYRWISLLATNGLSTREFPWRDRSLFVVGDVDQAIYGFRGADFQILLDFQQDFGHAAKLFKLEINYRSTPEILTAANGLITHNGQRIDKVLQAQRNSGKRPSFHWAATEEQEARYVVGQIKDLQRRGCRWSDMAVLYRVHSQSRAFEQVLLQERIPYCIVGGTSFFERQEIKDMVAYLRLLVNEKDDESFIRAVNRPRREIGPKTMTVLHQWAQQRGISLWEAARRPPEGITKRARQGLETFVALMTNLRQEIQGLATPEIIRLVIERTDYGRFWANDENYEERLANLWQLPALAQSYQKDYQTTTLIDFLGYVSLSTTDQNTEQQDAVRLMTIHTAKGLEFSAVFVVGLEQGLLPHYKALNGCETYQNSRALEEERRLCYVALTRAKDYLYLSAAKQRFHYGESVSFPLSQFLDEIPNLERQKHLEVIY